MATNLQFILYVPQQLLVQYEKILQEVIQSDHQDGFLIDDEFNQSWQKVQAFARLATDSPLLASNSYFLAESTEDQPFKAAIEWWKQLSSNIPSDQLPRLKYEMAFLRFQQQIDLEKPVAQALGSLQQRRLSLQMPSPISPLTFTTHSPFPLASLGAVSTSTPSPLDEAYNRVCLLFSSSNLTLSSYSFSDYWNRYCSGLSNGDKVRFLTALLYRFHLKDVDIPSSKVSTAIHPMEVFCWQMLAENISEEALTHILHQLPFESKVRLASLAFAHYREGSFFIVESLKLSGDPELIALIHICQRDQGNCISIAKELQALSPLNPSQLNEFIRNYELALVEKANGLFHRMQQLFPLIFKLHEARKEGNYIMREQYGSFDTSAEERASIDATYAREAATFASLFLFPQTSASQPPNSLPFDPTDFQRLIRTFGFCHLALPSGFGVSPHLSFLDALDALISVYSTPLSSYKINPSALHSQLNYLSNLLSHVQALKSPSGYEQGAYTTIFSLPTCGKELSRLSWLPSIAENLHNYCHNTGLDLQDFPIFVFDQSPPPLFSRNAAYVDQLNSRYGTRICIYSNDQILELSKKLHLGQLIDTTKEGRLGYGGARNTVYMLTPLLKELDNQGFRTPQTVLNIPSDHLRKTFSETVSRNFWTIHMGDDDAQIPYGYFLADLLLAQNYHGRSFVKCGEFSGRDTISINGIHYHELFDLEKILASPEILFGQTMWTKEKRRWGMCGALRSFGWSMLPFGNEETYNAEELLIGTDIRPSGFHLAGRRFPTVPLPSSPIIGTANRLKSYLPYLLETVMVIDLIEPGNKNQRTILPWKKQGIGSQPFARLDSVFETLASPSTEKAMRVQLLKNYWEQHQDPTFLSLFRSLSLIASHNIKNSINVYLQEHPQASPEDLQELEECRLVFEGFQRDAEALFLFNQTFFNQFPTSSSSDAWIDDLAQQSIPWKALLADCKGKVEIALGKPISHFPITRSLLLTLETIVGGELHETVRGVLQPDAPVEHLVKRKRPEQLELPNRF